MRTKTHIVQNECEDTTQEEATAQFILRTEELLAQLKDGRHKLDHAILTAMVIALPEEIAAVTDPSVRAELESRPEQAGIETIVGAGDTNRMMESISRLPEIFAQGLIEEHQHECDEGDSCALNDPTIAPYIGTLKAMAMTYARAADNPQAVQLLHKSLKEMGRKALRVAEMRQAMNQANEVMGNDDPTAIALAGEKAMAFMKLLSESGLLPPEAAERIQADLANAQGDGDSNMNAQEHTNGRKVTLIKNGPSTKQ